MNRLRKFAVSIGITFVVFAPLLFATPALADTQAGLTQDVYTYEPSGTPDRHEYTLCNSSIVSNMNFDVGGGVVANCQEDFVLIHWTGYITLPTAGEYPFQSLADDGFYMSIGGTPVIDNWWLKGCSGGAGTAQFEAGVSQKIDAWWYEYGGGACNYLYYNDPTTGFGLVPDSAFTTEAVAVVPPVVVVPEPPVVDPTPVDPNPPVVPPVVDPPVVPPVDPQPPVVVPPVDPPVVPPVPVGPPVVDPPVGPVVEPKPPIEIPVVGPPPVVLPPVPVPVVPEVPVAKPVEPSQPPIASVDPSTIDPQTLSPKEVAQLQEVATATLATEPEGSPAYTQALQQLAVAAQADDIVVDPQLASLPVLGATVVGITNAINAIGNIGADMSPAHRATAKKEVVAAVVATGAAISAATGAATGAASVSSSGSTSSSRRKE